jgi:hypothetical protein
VKKLLFSLLVLVSFSLTSCLDTLEEFTIAQDGSGIYKTTMDMGGLFDMIDMMAAMDTSMGKLKKFGEKDIDSTFAFRSLLDSAKDMTAEQRELMKDATMALTIKQKERVLRMKLFFPFRKLEDLQKLQSFNGQGKGLSLLGGGNNKALESMDDEGIPSAGNYYDTEFKPGLIVRKANEAKLAELKNGKLKDLQGAGDMLESMTFRTVINLPAAAKKLTGTKAKLSEDKKTVTIAYTMADFMQTPKALEFRIEY